MKPYELLAGLILSDVGYLAFLAEKYQERSVIPARDLKRGDQIVERVARGKKQLSRVADVDVHGRYGHGHIVVTVGRHLWRYEPLALVEIA